jgi:uncharacterized membrane protein YqjE
MSTDRGSGSASAGDAPTRGLLQSLRNIGPSLIGLLRTRLELFGIELAEEKERAAHLAVLAALVFLCAGLALLLVNVLVLAWFWDSHRYVAIVGLVVVYGGSALVGITRLQSALAARPPMFEATLAELKSDIEAFSRVRQD